jgi:hypothetical protein
MSDAKAIKMLEADAADYDRAAETAKAAGHTELAESLAASAADRRTEATYLS